MHRLPVTRHSIHKFRTQAQSQLLPLMPGLLISLTIVFAAHYLSSQHGSPLILTTVLMGMAFNNLSAHSEFRPGLEYCTRSLLRVGVALLGIRITLEHITEYGYQPLILVMICTSATIGFSLVMGRWLGADRFMALLTGVATAICGVSAAMALLALQSEKRPSDHQVAGTLVAITGISTVTMLLYPALLTHLNLSAETAGQFLGTSIHDVAQAIGAGEMLSPQAADATIYTKMLRVSLLLPVLLLVNFASSRFRGQSTSASPRVPGFLILFVLLMLLNNAVSLPAIVQASISSLSQCLLLMAMAALGIRTNLLQLFSVERRTLALVLLNTVFIALLAVAVLATTGGFLSGRFPV
ncbi:MAG: putative sulfate exporter family transporter [Pseudomonadota bacterium]|nr:putative sulfate exporter family transporter [Pseudomonadota bacterium]